MPDSQPPLKLNSDIRGSPQIHVPALVVEIMDTPAFQRLAQCKQLGVCEQVFRSATHNRFEHRCVWSYSPPDLLSLIRWSCISSAQRFTAEMHSVLAVWV